MMETFLAQGILTAIENVGFCAQENDYYIFLQIYSPQGRDFTLVFDKFETGDFDGFMDELYNRYEDFDVSTETMFWLNSEAQGKGETSDEIEAVIEDMEWFENKLFELYRAVKGVIANAV